MGTICCFFLLFRSLAPAYYKTTNDISDIDMPSECLLGIIPHSIRGFLSTYSQVLPATRRYQKCIACSIVISQEYKKNGFDFLLKVINSSKHLEDVTGLTELQQMTDVEAVIIIKKNIFSFLRFAFVLLSDVGDTQ